MSKIAKCIYRWQLYSEHCNFLWFVAEIMWKMQCLPSLPRANRRSRNCFCRKWGRKRVKGASQDKDPLQWEQSSCRKFWNSAPQKCPANLDVTTAVKLGLGSPRMGGNQDSYLFLSLVSTLEYPFDFPCIQSWKSSNPGLLKANLVVSHSGNWELWNTSIA